MAPHWMLATVFAATAALCLCTPAAAAADTDVTPQQITIAYDIAGGMAVSWETKAASPNPIVVYGTSPNALMREQPGFSTNYTLYSYTSNHIHHARLILNSYNTQFFYRCGDALIAGALSPVYNFTTAPPPGARHPFYLGLLGDLGQTKYSVQTLQHISANTRLQAIMLAGDLSYADLDEQRWDSWGKLVTPLTSSKPWMFAPGNHEIEDATNMCPVVACGPDSAACYADQSTNGCHAVASKCQGQCASDDWTCRTQCMTDNASGDNVTLALAACLKAAAPVCASNNDPVTPTFLSYNTRFFMPSGSSAGYKNEWYSWEAGPVHVIVLNSYAPFDKGTQQYSFLESDLSNVNRTATPWLIVVFHCPWYNSDVAHHGEGDAMKAVLEPLLFNAQVALVLSGHVHAMERTYPVYQGARNSRGPVYLVLGDGGNREGLATQYYDPEPVWSAFRQAEYGHGELMMANATHAYFEWHRDMDKESVVQDAAWIVNPWVGSTTHDY